MPAIEMSDWSYNTGRVAEIEVTVGWNWELLPASYEQCARFSSILHGLDFVLVTGMPLVAA